MSNVPGSTMLMPILDMTRQYINGMCYLLSQEPGIGHRLNFAVVEAHRREAAAGVDSSKVRPLG